LVYYQLGSEIDEMATLKNEHVCFPHENNPSYQ